MGKPTGFMEYPRELPTPAADHRSGSTTSSRSTPVPRGQAPRPGCPVHGLRRPVLPPGVPARQPDPRLERPGLSRPVAGGPRPAARHEQLPRVHRQALPRPVRSLVRARDQQRSGDDQADRGQHHRQGLGRGLGRPAAAQGADGQDGRGRRLRARRAWPAPSSSPAPATRSPSSSAPTGSAACSATASPTSRWRSGSSTAGSSRWRPRGSSSGPGTNVGVDVAGRGAPRRVRRRLPLRRRDPAPRPADRGPQARRHPLRHGLPDRAEPPSRRRLDRRSRVHHAPRQARDHHRRRRHRGRLPGHRPSPAAAGASTSSRSSRGRPTPRAGQPLAAVVERLPRLRRPTRRGESASTRSTPSGSWARTAASRRSRPSASR